MLCIQINFSFNFVLYVALNLQFRRTMRDLVCCWTRRRPARPVVAVRAVAMSNLSPQHQNDFSCHCCNPSPPVIARRVYFNRHLSMKAFQASSELRWLHGAWSRDVRWSFSRSLQPESTVSAILTRSRSCLIVTYGGFKQFRHILLLNWKLHSQRRASVN